MAISIDRQNNQLVKLIGLSTFLDTQGDLDGNLDEIVGMAANILYSSNCSIMLFKEGEEYQGFRLRLFAKYGDLPANAHTEAVKVNDGIAGKVAATGQALLVQNIEKTEFVKLARRPNDSSKSFICVPIVINRKVIGVFNVSNPADGRCYDQSDLNLSVFVALLVGKSVHVSQLTGLLKSRFAQLAMLSEAKGVLSSGINGATIDTGVVVKTVAKTFYREMTKAGFKPDHILRAAAEIVAHLNENLARHDNRLSRGGTTPERVSDRNG